MKKYELSIDSISEKELLQHVMYEDDLKNEHLFNVQGGGNIIVTGEIIAEALEYLSDDKRNIILLSYFLGMSDREIADRLKLVRRTVSRRRNKSLIELKKIMEELRK